MPRLLAIAAAVLVVPALTGADASAQVATATVSGVVLEAEGRTVIESADVVVVGTRLRSLTSNLGEFRFEGLEPGTLVLQVQHPGYLPRVDTIAVAPGERVEVRLTLSTQAIELEPIDVVARRGTLGTGLTGRFPGMGREEIDAVLPRTRHLADLIRTANIAGLRILETSVPGVELPRFCIEHPRARSGLRGPACISMNVYVDGRPALDPNSVFATMPPENIERFEILSPLDAASVYGDAGARGLVLIETRSGTGTTERRLPVFTRDLSQFAVAIALTGGSPGELYNGAAIFTFQQTVSTVNYREEAKWRPGLRLSARAKTATWLPEFELVAYGVGGSSVGTFQDGRGGLVRDDHDFRTLGLELVARPRLTKKQGWDLSLVVGPSWARETIDAQRSSITGQEGLGDAVARHMSRSWTTLGAVVGADLEWVLSPRSSILFGGRWRGFTAGSVGPEITEEAVLAGEELLQLPQANRRNGRRSLEIGYVRRLGGPPS